MNHPGRFTPLTPFAALATLALAACGPAPDTPTPRGMVTGTTGAQAIEGGVEILKAGGSAADAAMSTALTQICMAVGSWVSYAGLMTMVYYDAESGEVHNMNAAYNTVAAETDPLTIPGIDLSAGFGGFEAEPNGRTVLVPGFMKGVEAANERFGKLPFRDLFAPAIVCAEDGFEYQEGNAAQYAYREQVLSRLPETKAVFTKADGSPYQAGDMFTQPALARTLRMVAEQGTDYMYRGPWAEKLVELVGDIGGRMTAEDLASYEVVWSEPARGSYHGYDLYAHGSPAEGGIGLIEAMNLAELAGVSEYGHYGESPEALFWLTQISRPGLTFAIGGKEAADGIAAMIGADLTHETRVQKETSAKLWGAIQDGSFPGVVVPEGAAAPHSDAVVAIDQWGNIAAVVHSINTVSWGTTGIFVDGISIPDSGIFQQGMMAQIEPGSRLPDPTNPGLVLRDGKPFMGFSSIGSGLHQRTIGGLISVLDFGLTPSEAVDKPALGSFSFSALAEDGSGPAAQGVGIGDYPAEFIAEVEAMGQPIDEDDATRGYWIAIMIDPQTAELHGASIRGLALGGRAVGY
ncbi:MAG: hypothetical protein F4Y24_15915 [Gemmatimonadetes bacterium]|nr:hypothetical protein [Gemmatimonadota bacterium]MYG20917.1 hypothetical protein [Gemmatimonadota bacterium]MYJ39554.1 hypothetical protein [Gemmatimonadota bacterium]